MLLLLRLVPISIGSDYPLTVLSPQTLESLGVSEQLIAAGYKLPYFQIQSRNGSLIKQDFTALAGETKYPFGLMIQQPHTEITLTKILQERGVPTHRGFKV